jgi:hypothetical protein
MLGCKALRRHEVNIIRYRANLTKGLVHQFQPVVASASMPLRQSQASNAKSSQSMSYPVMSSPLSSIGLKSGSSHIKLQYSHLASVVGMNCLITLPVSSSSGQWNTDIMPAASVIPKTWVKVQLGPQRASNHA